jgi:hypothetical protein
MHAHDIGQRPQDYKELFNLRHSQLRNVIERIFGAAKKRFAVLKEGTRLAPQSQALVIIAVLVMVNFIRIYDPQDLDVAWDPEADIEEQELRADAGDAEEAFDEGELGGHISVAERRAADERRDRIAQDMWKQYTDELARCGR